SIVLSLSITTTFASVGSLTITLPEETYGESPAVTVEVYKGMPTSSSIVVETLVSRGTLKSIGEVAMKGNTAMTFMPEEAGIYCYYVYGEGYYTILKLFNVSEEDIVNGMRLTAEGGLVAGNGYEPTYAPELAPDTYKMDSRDATLTNWTDEILEHFTIEPQGYETPAFDGTDAANEFTSQEEMMAFVQDRTAKCDFMYLYSAGSTPNYGFDIPMVLVTTTEIPAGATLEEAAALVTKDGKANVWYQSQIHPNEPASGEGSLVIIDDFINDAAYQDMLDTINVIIVPRINPDGSYLFSRATYGGFDMNRDHTALKADELAQLHTAWRLFKTEVVIDTHEFTYFGYNTTYQRMSNADDIQTTPASSLNNDANLNALALDMAASAFEAEQEAGLRVNHYGGTGWTCNPPIGRCYFGLFDCLSFLVETRGIGAGKNNFERRVRSQEVAVTAYLEYTAEHADEIKEEVAQAREKLIESGKTYDEDNVFALYQTASGKKLTPYTVDSYTYKLDGTEIMFNEDRALPLNDTIERGRPRPTAYVFPADAENIEDILYIMDNQGAEYYELEPGSAAKLQQYYYVGPYNAVNGRTVGFEAGLRDEELVFFENGAYVIPMDQLAANVIAAICEPDVNDSNGYDGSLVQYGKVVADEDNNYCIYRYSYDNPRETLVSNASLYGVAIDVGASKSSAVNTISVDVTLTALQDLGAAVLVLDYDSDLTLTNVEGVSWQKGDSNLVVNQDVAAGEDLTITLCFAAAAGTVPDLSVKATIYSAAGQNEEEYLAGIYGSGKAYLCGDANEDGKVNAGDLVRLRNYIGMNGEGIDVGVGADANGDDVVNGLDLTALHRYFATTQF
ncbi:MAG: hypothetical protein K6G54_01945, partial [Oscillospiraceae bacterium]|nr:hypothetical protein [Oscillospiraceae bacterium]